MTFKHLTTTFFILFLYAQLGAQSPVRFYRSNLNKAIEMAKKQDKLIFVDAYAPWCKPCKKMDIEFRDRELANYFNNNFVNVKVDMESKIGKEYARYGIVFLPTFLILDQSGNIKIKVDRLLSAKELLNIAKQINGGDSFYASAPPVRKTTTNRTTNYKKSTTPTTIAGVTKSPLTGATIRDEKSVAQATKKTTTPPKATSKPAGSKLKSIEDKPDEKILYVLGADNDDMPPEVLMKEAYFRMNLMDGSHFKTARNYLETQSDWSTPSNIKFIFDFLHHTNSREFEYMINNRAAFEKVIGKEKIKKSIEILVYNKLYQGFPRPTLKEANKLYTYIDPATADFKSNAYFIERLYSEGKTKEFRTQAKLYLDTKGVKDHGTMYRYVFSYSDKELNNRKTLNKCIKMMQTATKLNNQSYEYFDLLASLYFKAFKKQSALGAAQNAVSLAKRYDKEYGATMILIEMIEDM